MTDLSVAGAPETADRRVVAFQGELGAFSEEALRAYFGSDVDPMPRRTFQAVVDAVESGTAAFGVLPVENTLAGSVAAAYDALADGDLEVIGEIIRPIRHFLLGLPGARLETLQRIVSHPVALAQCTRFLSGHPTAESVAVYDTAGGAMEVSRRKDPGVAAVAARGAGERYGLEVLAADIQDRDDNQTRFYVVRPVGGDAPLAPPAPARHKTVLLLEVENRPGALLSVLSPFAERDINLSKLESRPADVPWRYRFLLEVQARSDEERAALAIADVHGRTSALRILGSFPAAEDP